MPIFLMYNKDFDNKYINIAKRYKLNTYILICSVYITKESDNGVDLNRQNSLYLN